jgi:hypothetical protein
MTISKRTSKLLGFISIAVILVLFLIDLYVHRLNSN